MKSAACPLRQVIRARYSVSADAENQHAKRVFDLAQGKFRVTRSILARENDVFFCPGVDLAAVWAAELAALNFCGGPQFFSDGLAARR